MGATQRRQLRDHYLDSGPVLCLGGAEQISEKYRERYQDQAHLVAAVAEEIGRRASYIGRAGDDKVEQRKKKAAQVAKATYPALFAGANTAPSRRPKLLAEIKADLTAMWAAKNRGRQPHANENDGEAESIYWAAEETRLFVTNENDAPVVAKRHGVPALSFVDIANHLIGLGLVPKDVVSREMIGLQRSDIDHGVPLWGPLDLV